MEDELTASQKILLAKTKEAIRKLSEMFDKLDTEDKDVSAENMSKITDAVKKGNQE